MRRSAYISLLVLVLSGCASKEQKPAGIMGISASITSETRALAWAPHRTVEAAGLPPTAAPPPTTAAPPTPQPASTATAPDRAPASVTYTASATSETEDTPRIRFVNVFYATDRKETGNPKPEKYFGSDLISPHSDLNLGVCKVSIPTNHQYARLESYSYLNFETENNPEKHVKVLKLTTLAKSNFMAALQSRIQKSEGKEILVFIHGYNVAFDDAVRRTAQLAYDLKVDDKRGAPIMYSWPSRKKLFSYVPDETNIRATAPRLQKFLEMLVASSGAKHIHLLAHSMGSQGLSEALNGIGQRTPSRKLFDQVIFAAPDIDVNLFQWHLQNITNLAERITLYACTEDKALLTSRKVHGGLARLGLFLGVGTMIDTVDVTTLRQRDFIEHSYYGDVGVVLRDIQKLLRCRCSAEKRCVSCLKSTVKDGTSYWVLGQGPKCAHDE